jgi:hypothetical protein
MGVLTWIARFTVLPVICFFISLYILHAVNCITPSFSSAYVNAAIHVCELTTLVWCIRKLGPMLIKDSGAIFEPSTAVVYLLVDWDRIKGATSVPCDK